MPGEKDNVQPTFLIYVENKGKGEVLNPLKVENACESSITKEGIEKFYNEIHVKEARLSNAKLSCKQGKNEDKIILSGKKGVIECKLEDLIDKNQPAYLSPINLILEYGYSTTISKQFNIEKPVKR